jgi:hypothetical protein
MPTKEPLVYARFQFKPDRAAEFSPEGKEFVEVRYTEVDEIITDCKEFGDAIVDCTAFVNGKVITLSEQPEIE